MNTLKSYILLILIVCSTIQTTYSQYKDRLVTIGIGFEYPLFEEKYNPLIGIDVYVYCIGIGFDYGLLFNNEPIDEFDVNRRFGRSWNIIVFTKVDLGRISPKIKRIMLIPGYKYSDYKLTEINDLQGKAHFLFLRTEVEIVEWFAIYNKLDFQLSSETVILSPVVVSFGLRFFVGTEL